MHKLLKSRYYGTDTEIAEIAEAFLAGEKQGAIALRLGFVGGNTAVSNRVRKFVDAYVPEKSFAYAEPRKSVLRLALDRFYSGAAPSVSSDIALGPQLAPTFIVRADKEARKTRLSHKLAAMVEVAQKGLDGEVSWW